MSREARALFSRTSTVKIAIRWQLSALARTSVRLVSVEL